MRLPHLAPVVGLAAVLVSGCTASANLTTSASSVAEKAAAALQEKIGADEPPGLDCGDGQVELVQGTVVDCVLTDPATGTEYDAQVTITRAEGTSYSLSVESSSTPRGGSSASPTSSASSSAPSSTASSAPSTAVPTQVRQEDLAALAADALEPQLGARPEILCTRGVYLPLAVGEQTTCTATVSAGPLQEVTITITEVDGASYKINAAVG